MFRIILIFTFSFLLTACFGTKINTEFNPHSDFNVQFFYNNANTNGVKALFPDVEWGLLDTPSQIKTKDNYLLYGKGYSLEEVGDTLSKEDVKFLQNINGIITSDPNLSNANYFYFKYSFYTLFYRFSKMKYPIEINLVSKEDFKRNKKDGLLSLQSMFLSQQIHHFETVLKYLKEINVESNTIQKVENNYAIWKKELSSHYQYMNEIVENKAPIDPFLVVSLLEEIEIKEEGVRYKQLPVNIGYIKKDKVLSYLNYYNINSNKITNKRG